MCAFVAAAGAVELRFATTADPISMMDVKGIAEANGFLTYATEIELVGDEDVCLKLIVTRRE